MSSCTGCPANQMFSPGGLSGCQSCSTTNTSRRCCHKKSDPNFYRKNRNCAKGTYIANFAKNGYGPTRTNNYDIGKFAYSAPIPTHCNYEGVYSQKCTTQYNLCKVNRYPSKMATANTATEGLYCRGIITAGNKLPCTRKGDVVEPIWTKSPPINCNHSSTQVPVRKDFFMEFVPTNKNNFNITLAAPVGTSLNNYITLAVNGSMTPSVYVISNSNNIMNILTAGNKPGVIDKVQMGFKKVGNNVMIEIVFDKNTYGSLLQTSYTRFPFVDESLWILSNSSESITSTSTAVEYEGVTTPLAQVYGNGELCNSSI